MAIIGIGITAASDDAGNVKNVDMNADDKTADSIIKVGDMKKAPAKDSNMKVENFEDYWDASTVAKLYKNHSVGDISMSTGLSPSEVVKIIGDIKAGHYGDELKNSIDDGE